MPDSSTNRGLGFQPARQPLTPLQQGMLGHALQSPNSGYDIEQMVCTLPERIDPARLRAAWERAAARHESLHVRFDWSSAEPQQFVAEKITLPWNERAITADEIPAFLHADRFAAFDLSAAPLQRFTLLRVAENDFRLVWTFHHIILDGRSIVTLLHEVFANYDAAEKESGAAGPAVSADEPHPSVPTLRRPTPAADATFWKSQLRGIHSPSPVIIEKLGTLTPQPAQQEADHFLSVETTAALRALAESQNVTLNTLIQAAWAQLISRYSGEESVIFGATRACRHSISPAATGLLINTLPVAAHCTGDLPALLQSLRKAWLDMRPHELAPLSEIRRAAGLPADQPPFNHLVVFEHEDFTGALHRLLPSSRHRRFDLRELTTVPLTLQAYGGERLRLHCAFDTSKFDPAFIQRMLGHVAHLLAQFTEKPDAKLEDFTIATPDECTALLAQPITDFPSDTTLHAWFTETAALHPDRIAVTGSHGAWTYKELDARSNAIAAALIAAGTQRGDIVALLLDRTGHIPTAILGILKAGAAYLPIDPAYPAERAAFMTADSGVKVLLTDNALSAKVPAGSFAVINCDTLPATAPAPDISAHSPDDTAYIIFTSGSTGKPKGCMISHRNVVRLMSATDPWFAFNERDVWTLFHSSAFDFSVWEIWGALLNGGRLAVVPWLTTRSPEDFCRLLCQEGVTVLNQTPSAFRQLIAAEPLARSADATLPPFSLRYVIFGGEALEMQSLRPWFERHGDQQPQLVNMYGITETTVHVTYRPLNASDLTGGSVIGEPIPDLQLHVLDPRTKQPAPIGVPGEMYVAGAGLAKGYLNRPELTAERFPKNHLKDQSDPSDPTAHLYKTGDLARRLPNGDLEFLGRIDDQVKIRGFRIELGEIESVLCTHPDIREACVLVREDRPGDKRLCAWFVSATPPSAETLRAHLKSRLPDYMIPAAFTAMPAFPLTTNGKLDRRALPAPVQETATRTFTAPASPNEHTLAAIWAKILRLERVGTHDNFFELGGDSILSIQVIARAREAGLTLTPRQLFENPTVAALAALVMDTPTQTQSVAEVTGPFQPSPIQQWFLTQELEGANHWNQTFLFTVNERLDTAALTAALRAIIAHHSALRQRFIRRNNVWEASIHPDPDDDILTLHDFTGMENGRLTRQIERACKVEQARLSFEFGPLLRAAYMDCGEDRPGRLLITVHHLAVDGVSWRILLEDIEKAYRQAAAGKPLLPAATAPFSAWAGQVHRWAKSDAAKADTVFWQNHLTQCEAAATLRSEGEDGYGSNTEGDTYIIRTRLSAAETDALLQRVPAALGTRINAPLLASLVTAVNNVNPVPALAIHLEGHGRESHIGGDMDVSRTVGWFTTIFPVCLSPNDDITAGTRAIQQQVDALPGNGSGFSALGLKHEAAILFNYLGRMDAVTDGSELFHFAQESTGPWHCQSAERKYQIEINAQVIGGELEVAWTAGRQLHSEEQIQQFADGFTTALQQLIAASGTVAAAPHTALSGLDEDTIARLIKGQPGVVEISALSPMQQLFYSASLTKPNAGYDQWHCHLHGPLDVEKLRAAWSQVIARHSILRSSFHSAGLPHPVQIVREGIEPEWTTLEATCDADAFIAKLLTDDAGQRNDLTSPMLSRFKLVRIAADHHFLLWSLPDLHLDGWSWPIVFAEVNECYARSAGMASSLPAAAPYRTWLNWLSTQSETDSSHFWKQNLASYTTPTPLPADLTPGAKAARRTAEVSAKLDGTAITAAARSLSLSPGTFVQAAWSLLLAHTAGHDDIVFGTAFSGRPATLPGAESIVGPFVNNLPVRLRIQRDAAASTLLQSLQGTLLDLSEHQYTPITVIQDCTDIPWKSRLFNSLAVFQNYAVPDTARHFGDAKITNFTGPIHTAYPLTLVVTPGDEWNASLIFQESICTPARAQAILHDFTAVLNALAANASATCSEIQSRCKLPANCATSSTLALLRRPGGTAPRTKMEKTLAALWQRAFGIEDITTEDNFFDLGGGSLLMVRLHAAISQELQRDVPLVDFFRFPTIAAFARHLDPAATTATSAVRVVDQTQSRAAAARAAASKARDLRTR